MKIKAKIKGQDVVFELQPMEGLDYYDIESELKMGRMKFSQYAGSIIKECVASPAEARDIKFFKDSPRVLDRIIYHCGEISNAGLLKEEEIEIIED